METDIQKFHNALLAEVRRRLLEESAARLKKCLAQLNDEEIWQRPNEHSNSMGNLVLHLNGNVRQWILSGLAGRPDNRRRSEEFAERGPVPTDRMLAELDRTLAEVDAALDRLTPADLLAEHPVQGFSETGIGILVHVVEHFSYHVGQMTYYVKAVKDMDMGYYRGMDLERKGG